MTTGTLEIEITEIFELGAATHAKAIVNNQYVSVWVATATLRAANYQDRRGRVSKEFANKYFTPLIEKRYLRQTELGFNFPVIK